MIEENTKPILIRLCCCVALILIGVIFPVLAGYGVLKPETQPLNAWFQRTGSVTTVMGVWVEILLLKLSNIGILTGAVVAPESEPWPAKRFSSLYKFVKYCAAVSIVIGTVIWGYGDLIICLT